MNSSMPAENRAVVITARRRLKAETFSASLESPAPRSLEIRAPPPIPARPARDRHILKTGRISDTPATINGLFVLPR